MSHPSVSTTSTGAGATKPPSSPTPTDRMPVARRLQSEMRTLMMANDPLISAFPEGDDLFTWAGTITGAAGTLYEGLTYKLSLRFSNQYPYEPPTVVFTTPCWHPNVDPNGGAICLDILKRDKWSPAFSVHTLLMSLQSLLAEPNNDDPLNQEAARLWADQAATKAVVLKKYGASSSSS